MKGGKPSHNYCSCSQGGLLPFIPLDIEFEQEEEEEEEVIQNIILTPHNFLNFTNFFVDAEDDRINFIFSYERINNQLKFSSQRIIHCESITAVPTFRFSNDLRLFLFTYLGNNYDLVSERTQVLINNHRNRRRDVVDVPFRINSRTNILILNLGITPIFGQSISFSIDPFDIILNFQ